MKEGEIFTVYYSTPLLDMKAVFLVGQTCKVVEVRRENGRCIGCWAVVTEGRNIGEEWFIPSPSVVTKEMTNRRNNMRMLKLVR